ncbi:MAG: hypothetical protein HRT36_08585 [Alphaproteobacteria bacterium]|nr:hypothetical protein [Alphaproteobacteria bacterium]
MQHYEPLRLLRKTARALRLSDSALSQYELLLSYTKAIDWQSGNLCICWMSVQKVAEKLGKSVRQVQYNNKQLMQASLIAFRDSANYRRCGQRNKAGVIEWAYGVDLKPIPGAGWMISRH